MSAALAAAQRWQEYERRKRAWLALNPHSGIGQYEEAMRRIAAALWL